MLRIRRARWLPLALWLALLGAVCLLRDPLRTDSARRLAPPGLNSSTPLGTDGLGRDLAARIARGGLTSTLIGFAAAGAALLTGGTLGLAAGMAGGRIERGLVRIADLQQALPAFLLALALVAALGAGGGKVIFALALTGWPGMMRVSRALARQLRGREFMTAARALGARPARIFFRHLLPAAGPALAAHFCAQWAGSMMAEAGLSFLGLGLQPPSPSWGTLLKEGADHLLDAPHLLLTSGAAAVLTAWLMGRAAGGAGSAHE